MIIIYGLRMMGSVLLFSLTSQTIRGLSLLLQPEEATSPSHCKVVTKCFHVFWIPIVPIRSIYNIGEDSIPVRYWVSWRSMLALYSRVLFVIAVIGVLANLFKCTLTGDPAENSRELLITFIILIPIAFLFLLLATSQSTRIKQQRVLFYKWTTLPLFPSELTKQEDLFSSSIQKIEARFSEIATISSSIEAQDIQRAESLILARQHNAEFLGAFYAWTALKLRTQKTLPKKTLKKLQKFTWSLLATLLKNDASLAPLPMNS